MRASAAVGSERRVGGAAGRPLTLRAYIDAPKMAPKGSEGSNGVMERAVQSIEQCLRGAKASLDERMGVRVDVLHPMLTWL